MEGEKILRKVRHGGVESSLRAEVWPFLLNFYDLESTQADREAERTIRRQEYDYLKMRCSLLRERIAAEPGTPIEVGDGFVVTSPIGSQQDLSEKEDDAFKGLPPVSYITATKSLSSPKAREATCKNGNLQKQNSSAGRLSSKVGKVEQRGMSAEAREGFITWQRIIRLDAVRMNAEWVPYSPFQAGVTKRAALQLAMDVGLKQDEHLEPCLRHHAARVVAILEAYALYDPETGYCQGMSDLLSPFVALLDEDYQAFWCFAYFMYAVRQNFRFDEVGIRGQLQTVSKILKLGDPQLHQHLESIQAADCFFIYRMVVVLMRRELSFEQTISFWEILWADKAAIRFGKVKVKVFCQKGRRRAPPTENLLLYVIAAVIRQKRRFILEKCKSMDDILRECNSMSGKLDTWALLDDARGLVLSLHHKFQ